LKSAAVWAIEADFVGRHDHDRFGLIDVVAAGEADRAAGGGVRRRLSTASNAAG